MKKLASIMFVAIALAISASAQERPGPWVEWSKKDTDKMLNDSPWAQTQTETDTSEMFFTPTSQGGRGDSSNRRSQGATNQAVNLNFRVRFFSAKPIRQAFARRIILSHPNLPKDTIAKLGLWSEQHSDDWVIVAVSFDSTDQRYENPAMQSLAAAVTNTLKNDTYLERKDGKRVFLNEYQAPGSDGAGAKFVFARAIDGQPLLNEQSGEIRFHSEFKVGSNTVKIDRRFKVADMIYNGKLEY